MLFFNKLHFFGNTGDSLNPLCSPLVQVNIIQPEGGKGFGAKIYVHTNFRGEISEVEIVSGGQNYSEGTYIEILDVLTKKTWTTAECNLLDGVIVDTQIPIGLSGFSYPAFNFVSNQLLEPISVGLNSTQSVFVAERVWDSTKQTEAFVYPRTNYYGPFSVNSITSSEDYWFVETQTWNCTGFLDSNGQDIFSVTNFSNLKVGMTVIGAGIPAGTRIKELLPTFKSVVLDTKVTLSGSNYFSFVAYEPHNLRVGNTIVFGDTEYVVSKVLYNGFFVPKSIGPITEIEYSVKPVFRVYIPDNLIEQGFFLFQVQYNEDYPVISKRSEIYFFPERGDLDVIENGIRIVSSVENKLLPIYVGFSADGSGIFTTEILIDDVTFPEPKNFGILIYECETIDESEKLSVMLGNFGIQLTEREESLFRNSDVYEDFPDFRNLNEKRKELLLTYSEIFPYTGTYRGLKNIIKFLGYYDLRVKEYWLNVNESDENFGKYQFKDISTNHFLVSEKSNYKKTNNLGLFYDINKTTDAEEPDTDLPVVVDAFEFTNEEILLKLFGLKKYLKEKFLPLNTKIVDITGEGIYYSKFQYSSWNNVNNYWKVDLVQEIDFRALSTRHELQDLRPKLQTIIQTPQAYEQLPLSTYDIRNVKVLSSGGPYYGIIPTVAFVGTYEQPIRARVKVRAQSVGILAPLVFSGKGFEVGDIITLSGGIYEVPVRIVVNSVGPEGEILNFGIFGQGSGYTELPQEFRSSRVVRNGTLVTVTEDFRCLATDIPFEVEDLIVYDAGLNYTSLPVVKFLPDTGNPQVTYEYTIKQSVPVINLQNTSESYEISYSDEPGIKVGAKVDFEVLGELSWDEALIMYNSLGTEELATLKPYVYQGQIRTIKIVDSGKGYTHGSEISAWDLSGTGFAGTYGISQSSLKILEFEVIGVSSFIGTNNVLKLSGSISDISGIWKYIESELLPEGTCIFQISYGFSEIYLELYDGTPLVLPDLTGTKIKVHEGVQILNPGIDYSSEVVLTTKSNISGVWTWDTLAFSDFYQGKWEFRHPNFSFSSPILPLSDILKYSVEFPLVGTYDCELFLWNYSNTVTNILKPKYVSVESPKHEIGYVWSESSETNWSDTNDETWDSVSEQTWDFGSGPTWNSVDGLIWDDDELAQGTLVETTARTILDVIAEDLVEGFGISSYTNAPIPTIEISGQFRQPALKVGQWVFLKRNDIVYPIQILNVVFSSTNTLLELVSSPPADFKTSPETWQVLRYVGNTILMNASDYLEGFKYVKISNSSTNTLARLQVTSILTNLYSLTSGIQLSGTYNTIKPNVLGKLYRIRNENLGNGYLRWNTVVTINNCYSGFEINDHQGKLTIDYSNPLYTAEKIPVSSEIYPGYTQIRCYVRNQTTLAIEYEQRFLVTDVFETGQFTFVLEVRALDGIKFRDLDSFLVSFGGGYDIYFEYFYDEFISKTYSISGPNIELEFHLYPESGFSGSGWFFDYGIAYGEYTLEIDNVGFFGSYALLTLKDPEYELNRSDANYELRFVNYDTDRALENLSDPVWKLFEIPWNSCEYSWFNYESYFKVSEVPGFEVTKIKPGGNIQFGNYPEFVFTSINGSMSEAEKFAKGCLELRNSDLDGISLFDYRLAGNSLVYLNGSFDTYKNPTRIHGDFSVLSTSDRLFSYWLNSEFEILNATSTKVDLGSEIPKKLNFVGNTRDYEIFDIRGVLEGSINVGDVITGFGFPSYPADPSEVVDIFIRDGKIKRIRLSKPCLVEQTLADLTVERSTRGNSVSFIGLPDSGNFSLRAQSKTPGLDTLATIRGKYGILFWDEFLSDETSELHSYPILNVWQSVGAYFDGIQEFLTNFRSLQTYYNIGINPNTGTKGWFPSYLTFPEFVYSTDPVFDNVILAAEESERAPYVLSLSNPLTWDSLRFSKNLEQIPVLSCVLFDSKISKVPGKTTVFWRISKNSKILAELTGTEFAWTFTDSGLYEIFNEITDTNGNTTSTTSRIFVV